MKLSRAQLATVPALLGAGELLIALLICGVIEVFPQRLAFRHYDVPDGLPSSRVNVIFQDSKNYIWFGTVEGLSRFDGLRFTNYDTRDGLDHSQINTIIEDKQGRLWVGTNGGGVARLVEETQAVSDRFKPQPKDRKKFKSYRIGDPDESNRVNAMLFDDKNTLWCATDAGFFRSVEAANGDLKFELAMPYHYVAAKMAAVDYGQGHLWFGYFDGLIEVVDGHIIKHAPPEKSPTPYGSNSDDVNGIVLGSDGRLIVSSIKGVFEFAPPAKAGIEGEWRRLPIVLTQGQDILSISSDHKDSLWIGTNKGLIRYRNAQQTVYTAAQGLSDSFIHTLKNDRNGNLWIGTWSGGVCKLANQAILNFTTAEGLPNQNVKTVVESLDRRIYAIVDNGLAELMNGRVFPILGWPSELQLERGTIAQDNKGDWWMAAHDGLYHYKGPALDFQHGRRLGLGDGVSGRIGLAVYRDSSGTIWASTEDAVCRFDKAQEARLILQYSNRNPTTFITGDQSGDVWLMSSFGPNLRRWSHGKMLLLEPTEGLPTTRSYAGFVDSRGWLWIGLHQKGVSVTTDPSADHPTFTNYSTDQGLSGNNVRAITQDDSGRVYFATGRGLDQLDVATARIRHFTSADGLVGDVVNYCTKDSQGYIWVSTSKGLSRLDPRALHAADEPPSIFLSHVQVEGQDLPIPERGALKIPQAILSASQNNMLIEYVGLDFQSNEPLRYQHKLEGVDPDWSTPTEQRSINYARLTPASYRFLVRAVNEEGVVSSEPAVIEFRILPPIWQRWWFLSIAAVLVGLIIYAIHRNRVARLLELERVRTRIASDLHDDIGSSLSRMAILSEVAKQRMTGMDNQPISILTDIAESARGAADSMSDIVWAIDPRRDDLSSVVFRVRQFASDLLGSKGISWHLQVPAEFDWVKLNPEQRRHIFLIFKEAIINSVRHAACNSVMLELRILDNQIVGEIRDDGHGFVIPPPDQCRGNGTGGHGLENLRARAARLGGHLSFESSSAGTSIRLVVPLKRTMT